MIRKTVMTRVVAGLAAAAFVVLGVAGVAQANTAHPNGVSWASSAVASQSQILCC